LLSPNMSAASAVRQSLRRISSQRRHASSAVPKSPRLPRKAEPLQHSPLPPEKMRALVDLYHQTDSFITPENLSDSIDLAFVLDAKRINSLYGTHEVPYHRLKADLVSRNRQPKLGDSESGLPQSNAGETWSESRTMRTRMVMNALYGLEKGDMPGLELLEDEAERIQRQTQEDFPELREHAARLSRSKKGH